MTAPVPTESLASWLSEWIDVVDTETASAVTIRLAAIGDGVGAVVLDTVKPGQLKRKKKKGGAPSRAEQLEARLLGGAQAHCEAEGRPGRYAVVVQSGTAVLAQRVMRREPVNSLSMVAQEPSDISIEALGRHGLRYMERMALQYQRGTEAMMAMLAQQAESNNRELERHREREFRVMQLTEDLLDRQASRELEREQAEHEDERKAQGMEKLGAVAQVLIARLSGADPASVILKQLPIELVEQLLERLDEEGQAAFREILEANKKGEQGKRKLLQLTIPEQPSEPTGTKDDDAEPDPSTRA